MASHFYTRVLQGDRTARRQTWKLLAITFISVLFLIAMVLAVVHISKPSPKQEQRKMATLDHDNAILKYFGLADGIKLKWGHGVNSQKELSIALNDSIIQYLEADVILEPLRRIPIMAHPPANTSDITLEEWLDKVVKQGRKGMKLDFKGLQAVEPSLQLIRNHTLNKDIPPVLLNADILQGPNSPSAKPVNGSEFIRLCTTYFKKSVLSIGWTTAYNNAKNDGYSQKMVEEMYDIVKNVQQEVTFPVRASLTFQSKKELLWLLMKRDDFTLTVWTGKYDIYDVSELKFLRDYPTKVFYDLPDDQLKEITEP